MYPARVYIDHKIPCTLGYMIVVSLKPSLLPYRALSFIGHYCDTLGKINTSISNQIN